MSAQAVIEERIDAARAKPVLRDGIEHAVQTSVRGEDYVMLKSPGEPSSYLRLSLDEWELAQSMDGSQTVTGLVADYATISGQLAPDLVIRLVAGLAASGMLEELPDDAFNGAGRIEPETPRKRRFAADVDGFVGFLYRAGGKLLFTRAAAIAMALVALAGMWLFGTVWAAGEQSIFLVNSSYVTGALVLLGLNVFALACHELGHALAAKHAGRRVRAAGLTIAFGTPSFFVDTTDVWMAGRRARILTTASGLIVNLVLAGSLQIIGFLVPAAAPWAFKLSFLWYLNTLLNLSPFLALDGYYLLREWLELPNLRARGMAWLAARIQRRPPHWSQLDREGRLVALYAVLTWVWLVIAVNLGYRAYTDRVSGVITGLWNSGWPQRLVLIALIAGLTAPVVYTLSAWLGRFLGMLRDRFSVAGIARRVEAMRATNLGRLGDEELKALAKQGRWIYPLPGERLYTEGRVFVVASGAVEGRHAGDRPGTVRERVNAGGLVRDHGLVWHTAGTKLLSLPESAVDNALGPHRSELAELVPGLPDEVLTAAVVQEMPAGERISPVPDVAFVVASGMVTRPGGEELSTGAVLDPAVTHEVVTPARLWRIPIIAATDAGMRSGGYPPLDRSPTPSKTDSTADEPDAKLERRLRLLLTGLITLAILLTGSHALAGPVWSEMPTGRALLSIAHGTALLNGEVLDKGDEVYVRAQDRLTVGERSLARLTFRGGSFAVLCAGSTLTLGPLWTDPGRPLAPAANLQLTKGRLLTDTEGTSSAFGPIALTVRTVAQTVINHGAARFAVVPEFTEVVSGAVTANGQPQELTPDHISCGATDPGVILRPTNMPTLFPTVLPTVVSTVPGTSIPPVRTPSRRPSSAPPSPTPGNAAPTLQWAEQPGTQLDQSVDGAACGPGPITLPFTVSVVDDHDVITDLVVEVHWNGSGYTGTNDVNTSGQGLVGPIADQAGPGGGTIDVWVTATDTGGLTTRLDATDVTVLACGD